MIVQLEDAKIAVLKAAAVIKVDWDKGPHANVSSEDMTQSSRDIIADDSLTEESKTKLIKFLSEWLRNHIDEVLGDLYDC